MIREDLQPYRDLAAAVILQAELDRRSRNKYDRPDLALRWIDSDADGCGTFAWYCYYLGLEPKTVRQRLRQQRRVMMHATGPRRDA